MHALCWFGGLWPRPLCLARGVSGEEQFLRPVDLQAEYWPTWLCCRAPRLRANPSASLLDWVPCRLLPTRHLNVVLSADNCQGISNCSCLPLLLLG